ncbi:uncharacterized protein LOC129564663 [Sitodiplosis mosellana]|uniref:uncharacterized protein LOC129564663 n=1 Tax=Sitodiplosis mosellana TaxID=263140 RepID=UPI002445104F|nr:uncharacterized protein LOC129564663 [Sitodiplosis mosellana]
MSSITKHQYDFTNGKCANKENVSTNGKRSEVKKSSSGIDSNFDWAEKQAISQQRKLRLIQVRQQSKEIAAQVRENVRKEEQRQIELLNRVKEDEVLKWRQKQLGIIEQDYQTRLAQIGEAHLNAARENDRQQQFEEQKEKNRRLALKRGKIAAQKLKEEQNMKPTKQTNKVKEKQVVTVSKKVESSPETSSDSSTSSSSSSDSSTASVILVEDKKKPQVKNKIPAVSKSVISPKKKTSSTMVKPTEYNPSRYASANNSTATDFSLTDSPMSDPPPLITKVSDLLGRRPAIKSTTSLRSSPHIAKTYKLDKSPVSTRSVTRKTPQKSPMNAISSRLSRVIKTPSKTSGKSPMKVLPERKHFVPEFVRGSTSTATTQRPSKVQFYDHANKYTRQYDGNIDLIEKVQKVTPLSAWDEARRKIELDEVKRTELLNMKKLAENRSKVALEKEKIRRDYELMSTQLSEILKNNELANSFVQTNEMLSESRLKRLAEEKQQLMNEEFRSVLKKPTVITCPKVNPKGVRASSQQRSDSDDLNVAEAKSKARSNGTKPKQLQKEDVSSDSTNSFLLDYVTERSNNITDDINRCRNNNNDKGSNQTKIKALHELLNQVNSFRRLLCEEIQQNNGDISRIDTSQFMTEIDKVEEKQQEIMNEKSVEKTSVKKQSMPDREGEQDREREREREQELKERERLLKIKESCIDEKARQLYLREKKIVEQKNQPIKSALKSTKDKNAVAVVTANGTESRDDIPVRIVINVNKNEQRREKSTEVVVNDVKWGEKLKKSSKENIQIVPVTNGNGKIYPKTPAKSKVTKTERKEFDILSESTTLTAYLSPPVQVETQLTKAMQHGAISNDLNNQSSGENKPVSDTELLHYVIRMLGMSRTSIEQLNMSSVSTVRTPNSSIINVSSNRQFISSTTSTPISHISSASVEQLQLVDKAKLQQLARFLAENNKLATKTRKDSKESGASSGVWDDILSKKNEPNSKSEKTDNAKPKPTKEASLKNDPVQDPDEKLSRDDLIAKYDELAANCTKRIINLDSMISKVREEKQKLLENTLSSASSLLTGQKETGPTEYLDIPQPEQNQKGQQVNGSPLSDSKGTNAPSSDFSSTSGTADTSMPIENRASLFASRNKPLGESKDSGVGNSRPVTSSDYRESPDLKQTTKAAELERNTKLLQNALRESQQKADFVPFLKDVPKFNYSSEQEQQKSLEPMPTNSRDKSVKPPPPVAMTRYSPQLEDELPHELSTITEVDTPVTSRLNATDMTNVIETTTKNGSIKLAPDDEALKLLYKAFPNFKEYIKANPDISQLSLASVNESIATGTSSVLTDTKLVKLLEGVQTDDFNYRTFQGDRPDLDSIQLNESELALSYKKFPTHSEYAKSVPGLLDSQSIEQVDLSDATETSNSSLPDIVNELKSRKILEHSFEEAKDKGGNLDDLLVIHSNRKTSSLTTLPNDEVFSDALENELNDMGLAWVSAELKKSKAVGASTSQSSDSSNHGDKSRQPSSPVKPKAAKRTFQKMNQSKATNDSFVDKNLVATHTGTVERNATTSQPTDPESLAKSIKLKDFLARELLKHSSISSSSDSSMVSIFLKSFLGPTSGCMPETPQNRGVDKQRTSTPVDHSSDGKDSGSRKVYRTSSTIQDSNKNQTESPTFFSNDSQISSVRMSTTDSTS